MSADVAADTSTEGRDNRRKQRVGVVISAKPDKTVVVQVTDRVRHRRYEKTIRRNRKLHVHDEQNDVNEGDTVRIEETRPISKLKRWRVVEVLERAR